MNPQNAARSLIALAALPILPVESLAQTPDRFAIVTRAGVYAPTRDIGPAAPAGGPWYLRLEQADAAPAFELELSAKLPGDHFATRLVGLATLPADVSGFFDCYPGLACPAVLLPSDAEMGVLAAALDVLYSPMRADRPIRPFAMVGAGIKQYRFSWPDAAVLVTSGDHAETAATLRAGVGIEFDLAGQSIRAELADWWSARGSKIGDDPGIQGLSAPRRRAQHDITLSIGWRLVRF